MRRFFLIVLLMLALPLAAFAQEEETELPEGFVEYSTESGSLTFIHPEEWEVISDPEGFYLTNAPALVEAEEELEPAEGEFAVYFAFTPISELEGFVDPESETMLEDFATLFTGFIATEETTVGEIEFIEATDEAAEGEEEAETEAGTMSDQIAQVTLTAETYEGYLWAFQPAADALAISLAVFAPGEGEAVYEDVLTVINSIEIDVEAFVEERTAEMESDSAEDTGEMEATAEPDAESESEATATPGG